jgi:succinylarginine dihydrolase
MLFAMCLNAHLSMMDLPAAFVNVPRHLIGNLFAFEFLINFRRQAHLAVLAESCDSEPYNKLIEALCAEHNINLIKIADEKSLENGLGSACLIVREMLARSWARAALL